MSAPVFQRVLLKLSGEAMMGEQAFGIDPAIDRKSTRLNSSPQSNLVCRLLLEKKKRTTLMQLFGDQHVGDHVEAATAVCLGHHGDRRQSHLSGLLQHRQATLLGIVMSVGQRPYSTC